MTKPQWLRNALEQTHPSWHALLDTALAQVDANYLLGLETHHTRPLKQNAFNAFSHPIHNARFILLGESPYPRAESANGYAFWDQAVKDLFSDQGLSKPVNRATSLRNFIKMLLIVDGRLHAEDCSQATIAKLDKSNLVTEVRELFNNMLEQGFILMNASLFISDEKNMRWHAKHWQPFACTLLSNLHHTHPSLRFLLFGNVAQALIKPAGLPQGRCLIAEHPYNISFITNPAVCNFFAPLRLLNVKDRT